MLDHLDILRLTFHPIANLFPLMTQTELEQLAADIGAHGIREPIVINMQGQILDGRNRYRAWLWHVGYRVDGLPLRTRLFGSLPEDGADEIAFVISANLMRRHLSESQRAMLAARLAVLPRGANQHAQIDAPSQEVAAQQCSVSRRLVQNARIVQTKGSPELINAVDRGVIRVSAAAGIVHLPLERQMARIERDRLKSIGESRQREDWYRTGAPITEGLLTKERFGRRIWDPCAGDGSICVVLEAHGYEVIATDLYDRNYGQSGVDFLATDTRLPEGCEDLVMNPPNKLNTEFAQKALAIGARKVALLAPVTWFAGLERYETIFSRRKLVRAWTIVRRQTLWRGDQVAEASGGMADLTWFILERDGDSDTAQTGWIV
jgi:hypothetical protein